jgi:hypothetical protein
VRLSAWIDGRDIGGDALRAVGPDHPITLYLAQVAGIGHLVLSDDAVGDQHSRPLWRSIH